MDDMAALWVEVDLKWVYRHVRSQVTYKWLYSSHCHPPDSYQLCEHILVLRVDINTPNNCHNAELLIKPTLTSCISLCRTLLLRRRSMTIVEQDSCQYVQSYPHHSRVIQVLSLSSAAKDTRSHWLTGRLYAIRDNNACCSVSHFSKVQGRASDCRYETRARER